MSDVKSVESWVGSMEKIWPAVYTEVVFWRACSSSAVGGYGITRGTLAATGNYTIGTFLGSTLTVEVVGSAKFGPHDAVVPQVSGSAYFTGRNEFWFDPGDPWAQGFIFR